MSKWNRPMRRYQPGVAACRRCGDAIRSATFGWEHIRRLRIKDPEWHLAVP